MIKSRSLIIDMDELERTKVKLVLDENKKIMEKRMVNILTKQGQKSHIPNVYYALGLKHNLLSVGQLTQKGCNLIFKGYDCFIYNKNPINILVSKVNMTKNNMYPLTMHYDKEDDSFS